MAKPPLYLADYLLVLFNFTPPPQIQHVDRTIRKNSGYQNKYGAMHSYRYDARQHRQGTASFWATVREETDVAPRIACVQKFGKGLATQVRDLADRYDEIVIDAGGRDSMELRYALSVADKAYIPVQPFQFDIWTLQQMEELVEMASGLNDNLGNEPII